MTIPSANAEVVCSMLGIPGGAIATKNSLFGEVADFGMSYVRCKGTLLVIKNKLQMSTLSV